MWKFLLSPSPRIYINLERIPISDVPDTMDQTMTWLHSRFELKDVLIARHFELQQEVVKNELIERLPMHDVLRFGAVSKLPLMRTLPSAFFLTSLTVLLLTKEGRLAYFASLFGGSACTVLYSKFFF